MQARSSVYDAASPKESDASMTPLSAMGAGRPRGFFKEQPTSTKNTNVGLANTSTPKAESSKVIGAGLQTPKINMPGLDLSKLASIKEADE